MDVFGLVLVIAVVSFGIYYVYQRSPRRRLRRNVGALKAACSGDQDLMERLIFAEMQRAPGLDLAEAARRARVRLERDRR